MSCCRTAVLSLPALVAATAAAAQEAPLLDFRGPATVQFVIVILVTLTTLIVIRRVPVAALIRDGVTWLAVFVIAIAAYAYRDPLRDVGLEIASVVVPGLTLTTGQQVVVSRGVGGHFVLDGSVGGTSVEFVFDTGASTVVLTAEDAGRAGYDLETLDFRLPASTAAGMTVVAPVRIDELSVGGIRMRGVRAAVARPGNLQTSLLGMSFLDRLGGYNVRRDRLVLIP